MHSSDPNDFSNFFSWYTPTNYVKAWSSFTHWESWLASAGVAFLIALAYISIFKKEHVMAPILVFVVILAIVRPIFYHVMDKPSGHSQGYSPGHSEGHSAGHSEGHTPQGYLPNIAWY